MRKLLFLAALVLQAAGPTPLEVPLVRQEKNGCGAASVAMVVRYWGRNEPTPKEIYARLYEKERGGIPLSGMKAYLEHLGFRAFTLHGEWGDLTTHTAKGRPGIVGLRKNERAELHFVVVAGTGKSEIWMNDPAKRKTYRMKRSEFEQQWRQAEKWMLLAAPAGS